MANPRTLLHLALALTLLSLTCDLGVACAMAGMEKDCCCEMADGSTPCTDVSDGDETPGAPAQAATFASAERFSVAVLDASPAAAALAATPGPGTVGPRAPVDAADTPLYLSHCAFLC